MLPRSSSSTDAARNKSNTAKSTNGCETSVPTLAADLTALDVPFCDVSNTCACNTVNGSNPFCMPTCGPHLLFLVFLFKKSTTGIVDKYSVASKKEWKKGEFFALATGLSGNLHVYFIYSLIAYTTHTTKNFTRNKIKLVITPKKHSMGHMADPIQIIACV